MHLRWLLFLDFRVHLDVPGAPTGPLEATDVKADEITLQWKAPTDDGGEPITNYILEKRPKGSERLVDVVTL